MIPDSTQVLDNIPAPIRRVCCWTTQHPLCCGTPSPIHCENTPEFRAANPILSPGRVFVTRERRRGSVQKRISNRHQDRGLPFFVPATSTSRHRLKSCTPQAKPHYQWQESATQLMRLWMVSYECIQASVDLLTDTSPFSSFDGLSSQTRPIQSRCSNAEAHTVSVNSINDTLLT